MEIPFALDPNAGTPPRPFGDINIFDYSNVGAIQYKDAAHSLWQDLGSQLEKPVDWVFDTASGAWVSTKEAVSNAVSGVGDKLIAGFDWVKYQVFIIVGAIVLVVWALAKSGAVPQVTSLISSVYGH